MDLFYILIDIPFWLFSTTSSGGVNVDARRVRSWRSGDYLYTKTDYYDVVREGSLTFVKVPNDGAIKFDDAIMNSIEPFDYSGLEKFDHSYLSGFLAEKYDLESDEAKESAKNRAENTFVSELKKDIKSVSIVNKLLELNKIKIVFLF